MPSNLFKLSSQIIQSRIKPSYFCTYSNCFLREYLRPNPSLTARYHTGMLCCSSVSTPSTWVEHTLPQWGRTPSHLPGMREVYQLQYPLALGEEKVSWFTIKHFQVCKSDLQWLLFTCGSDLLINTWASQHTSSKYDINDTNPRISANPN